MSGFDYTKSRDTAEKLIARFGQAGVLRRKAASGTAYAPTINSTDYAVRLVDLNYNETEIDGTLIKTGDRLVYLSTEYLTVTPAVSDYVVIGGIEHTIQNVMPLSPGGVDVYYKLQVRK